MVMTESSPGTSEHPEPLLPLPEELGLTRLRPKSMYLKAKRFALVVWSLPLFRSAAVPNQPAAGPPPGAGPDLTRSKSQAPLVAVAGAVQGSSATSGATGRGADPIRPSTGQRGRAGPQ